MTVENQDYKLKILEDTINQCIDSLLPNSSEDALSIILYQSNEIVWRVATEIYTKSGHKIDFLFIRDILNLRIEPLQNKIAEEERIRNNREAEATRIRAEQERIRKQREKEEQKKLQEFKEVYLNIDIDNIKVFGIFTRIKNLLFEQLEIDESQITLDSVLSKDLGAYHNFDWRNASYMNCIDDVEIIMAIEEEFNIEVPDEECENLLSWNVGQLVSLVMQKID